MAEVTAACPFFDKLPAEIRLSIYELAFTSDTKDEEEVDLTATKPPSQALLLTCKKTHSEACDLYTNAYRRYWNNEKFIFRTPALGSDTYINSEEWEFPKDQDLDHIENLRIRLLDYDDGSDTYLLYRMVDPRGRWEHDSRYSCWSAYPPHAPIPFVILPDDRKYAEVHGGRRLLEEYLSEHNGKGASIKEQIELNVCCDW